MGLLERVVKGATAVGWPNPGWPPPLGYSGSSITGLSITPDSALSIVAVFAAVKLLSEDVAKLPLHLYQGEPGGAKRRAYEHPTYRVLHDVANPEMTAMVWRETMTGHLLTWGNAYSELVRNASGQVIAAWPLRPDRMTVTRDEAGARAYDFVFADGSTVRLRASQVFHLPGFGFDGLIGYSPIARARRALEVAMAAEEYGGRFFANDARPGVVYSHPKTLSDTARANLRKSLEERHEGLSNAQRFALLEEGMSVTAVGIPPEDAQFLETRRFGIEEVARLYRLAPTKLSDYSRATFSNIEESNIDHVVSAMQPILVRWEQQIGKDVIGALPGYFAEHLVAGLLRGNTLARYQAYAVGRQWGWLSADDIRSLENMNPLPDGAGSDYLAPLNMTPAELLGQATSGAATPKSTSASLETADATPEGDPT